MFVEEQEIGDWSINLDDDNNIRKEKSISSYWLTNWYENMKEYTFETVIYDSIEKIPEILPWKKSMVRYENKSPKDSEFWGAISTKKELENVFYTSLRCKTNPGKFYCVREWIDLSNEYRCFWNNRLVAISSESIIKPPIEKLLEYVNKIKSSIKYHKCVFDIGFVKETNELIFIEYNSWETNSGSERFDWNDDKEIFYHGDSIVIRWNGGEEKIEKIEKIENKLLENKFKMDLDLYMFVENNYPSNYLITEKNIYISNDIWLGLFDYNLDSIKWIKGVFRFDNIELCVDGSICIGNKNYYSDLRVKKTKSKKINKNISNSNNIFLYENTKNYRYGNGINYRYGIPIKNKNTSEMYFVRMLDSCELVL